jgi:hypothetical protein
MIPRFIKAKDTLIGDTIAWRWHSATNTITDSGNLLYTIVDSVAEDETPQGHPAIEIKGKIYAHSDFQPETIDSSAVGKLQNGMMVICQTRWFLLDYIFLLINRKGE